MPTQRPLPATPTSETTTSHCRARTRFAGREVVRLAFGTMRLAGAMSETVRDCLHAAADSGIDVLDTAPIYGFGGPGFGDVEERLGAAWADEPALRERFTLVTKVGLLPDASYDSSPDTLISSCEASLRRLRTDRLDVLLVHRPDHLAGHRAVADALDRLVASGKVGAVGVSNHAPAQFRALGRWLSAPLATNQIEFSPLAIAPLGDGTLDQCEEMGIPPMAWSPLGGGRLAGTSDGASTSDGTNGNADPRTRAVRAALGTIADRHGVGLDVAALAWLLAHPSGVIPILGTARVERIRSSVEALSVTVDRADWYTVLVAARGSPMP